MRMPDVDTHSQIRNEQHKNTDLSTLDRITQHFIYVTEITEGDKL